MKKKSAECVKLRVNEKGTKHNAIWFKCRPCSQTIWLTWPKFESVASILGVVLLPMISALPASESGCWLSNPLCTPHSCSSASRQWLTSFQNSPGGDLQSPTHPGSTPSVLRTPSRCGLLPSFILTLMDYALISRSAYDFYAMEKEDKDRLAKYVWQMLDMRSRYTLCKTIQVCFRSTPHMFDRTVAFVRMLSYTLVSYWSYALHCKCCWSF